MISKWNNGQKRVLSIRKKGTQHSAGGASAPHAPHPFPSTPLSYLQFSLCRTIMGYTRKKNKQGREEDMKFPGVLKK